MNKMELLVVQVYSRTIILYQSKYRSNFDELGIITDL